MILFRTHVRWVILAGLFAALVAVPAGVARSQDKAPPVLTEADKQKQIEALQKQLLDLQGKLEALKTAPVPVASAVLGVPDGTIPEELLKPFTWR